MDIKEAKAIICGLCHSDMCEWCQVERVVSDAEGEAEGDYIPSSTNRDYSPSNPWDAPGMSIRDFI